MVIRRDGPAERASCFAAGTSRTGAELRVRRVERHERRNLDRRPSRLGKDLDREADRATTRPALVQRRCSHLAPPRPCPSRRQRSSPALGASEARGALDEAFPGRTACNVAPLRARADDRRGCPATSADTACDCRRFDRLALDRQRGDYRTLAHGLAAADSRLLRPRGEAFERATETAPSGDRGGGA